MKFSRPKAYYSMNKDIYKDKDKNAIRISEFVSYEGETKFTNIAAKFVIKGKETYFVEGKKFVVKQGEYIIGNNEQISEVSIAENTQGLCMDVSNEIITEVLSNHFENPDLNEFLLTDKFLINKYNSQNTNLGHKLSQLSSNLFPTQKEDLLSNEFFYCIGESIIHDQSLIFEQYSIVELQKTSRK
jgi:hypothetical protein